MREGGFEGVQRQTVAAAHGERPSAARSKRHRAKGAGPFLRLQFEAHAWGSCGLAQPLPDGRGFHEKATPCQAENSGVSGGLPGASSVLCKRQFLFLAPQAIDRKSVV